MSTNGYNPLESALADLAARTSSASKGNQRNWFGFPRGRSIRPAQSLVFIEPQVIVQHDGPRTPIGWTKAIVPGSVPGWASAIYVAVSAWDQGGNGGQEATLEYRLSDWSPALTLVRYVAFPDDDNCNVNASYFLPFNAAERTFQYRVTGIGFSKGYKIELWGYM